MLQANMEMLLVEQDLHSKVASSPLLLKQMEKTIDDLGRKGSLSAKRQFRWLLIGSLLFICWHITEIAVRSNLDVDAKKTNILMPTAKISDQNQSKIAVP